MGMRARVILGALLLAGFPAAVSAQPGPTPDERKLFRLLNQERDNSGLPQLEWDDHLAQSARAHAQLLANHKSLSHQFAGEPELMTRIGATGLRFDMVAENVGRADSVEAVHEALMFSPPHRANILGARYTAAGVAIVARNGRLWVAQNFARVLPNYSEAQFREEVVAAFNRVREGKGIAAIAARPDDGLRSAACSGSADLQSLIQTLPGASELQVFTSSVPQKLPPNMSAAALDARLRRLGIAVCFRPGSAHGYGSFSVVAAFYPAGSGR
jgi:hypothetical protein